MLSISSLAQCLRATLGCTQPKTHLLHGGLLHLMPQEPALLCSSPQQGPVDPIESPYNKASTSWHTSMGQQYGRWQPEACSSSAMSLPLTLRLASTTTIGLSGGSSLHGQQGLSLLLFRGYAAPGAGGKSPIAKRRRSQLKFYSVRNNKLRSNFEQVWPTLKLTEEEASLFKRNSRVFVTDLGKNIPLTTKFELAKATPEKVPHLDARSMLYESDLHLDAVGEHPRFLRIRRLRTQYAVKLQNLRKLRVLMGFSRRYVLQNLYELSLTQPGPDRVWKFMCAMDSKLPNAVLRMGLASDIMAAKSHVSNAAIAVNGCREPMPRACHVQPGDMVGPNDWSRDWFRGYMASHMGQSMRDAVHQSWDMGGKGNLSGPRVSEVLQTFGSPSQAGSEETHKV